MLRLGEALSVEITGLDKTYARLRQRQTQQHMGAIMRVVMGQVMGPLSLNLPAMDDEVERVIGDRAGCRLRMAQLRQL